MVRPNIVPREQDKDETLEDILGNNTNNQQGNQYPGLPQVQGTAGIEIMFPVGLVSTNKTGQKFISNDPRAWQNWERGGKLSKQTFTKPQLENLATIARYSNPILFNYIKSFFPKGISNDDAVDAWNNAIDISEITGLSVNDITKNSEFKNQFQPQQPAGPTVQTFLNQLDTAGARVVLEETFGQLVGRRPTKKEVDKFKNIVNKRMSARPAQSITSTIGNTVTQQTIPGYGEEDIALEARRQAEARPEFAGYQMATTFYDAILRAAGSPARVASPTE